MSLLVNPPASPKAERQLLSKLDEVNSVMEDFMKTLEEKKSELDMVLKEHEKVVTTDGVSSLDAGELENIMFR